MIPRAIRMTPGSLTNSSPDSRFFDIVSGLVVTAQKAHRAGRAGCLDCCLEEPDEVLVDGDFTVEREFGWVGFRACWGWVLVSACGD
jgi:hypothetical protein